MKPSPDRPAAKPESKPDAPAPKDDLKSLPLPEVEKKLGSSPAGLSQAEAQKRLAQYGPNEITEKKDNLFLKFLTYFWGPIPWMIEGAVILSGVVRHWLDFFIILFLLFSNALVAFWEEHQAGNELSLIHIFMSTGATDSAQLRLHNVQAYGLLPFPLTETDVLRMHADDERLPLDSFRKGVEFLYRVVNNFVVKK